MKLYHYTSLATLALILKNRTIMFNRLDRVDDVEEGTINTLNLYTKKPQCLSQITLIIADKPQNHKTALTSPNCLSLRNNAACCIPLRDLRYLRENRQLTLRH